MRSTRRRPSALLLHGGPSMPHHYLAPLAAELEQQFEAENYQQGKHDRVMAYVEEAVARLTAPRWLIGHSWGGYLAMQLAATIPDRVQGLILICSLAMGGDGGLEDGLLELDRRVPGGRTLAERWPGYFAGPAPSYPGWELDEASKNATHQDLFHTDVSAQLRCYPGPVLALCGERDFLPIGAMRRTVDLFPNAKLDIIPGTAHFPWIERPGAVAEATRRFLAEVEPGPAAQGARQAPR